MPRPKSFDPETVLAKAMGVFWEKGYDAASIADLTAAMGINRFSLYDTFGDKRALYLKALDCYEKKVVGPMIERVNAVESLDDLVAYFDQIIDLQHAREHMPCCLLQKATVAHSDDDQDLQSRIEAMRSRFHGAFREALTRCRAGDDFRIGVSIQDAAWVLMLVQAGLLSSMAVPIPKRQARAAIRAAVESFRP
jgi:TetR/AcrR family transcriptional regulator, transcriptional repressor for nem operon